MSDLGELIRDYYESVADPVTVEEILYGAIGEGLVRPLGTPPVRRRRRFRGRLRVHELPHDKQRRDKMTDSKIDQPTPGSRKPRVRRGLAIGAAAAALVIIVGVVAFVFVADDGTDVAGSGEVETGPITSFEDIAGTIYKIGPPHEPIYIQFSVDGTWNGSTIRNNLVEDRPSSIFESRFEGTKIFVTETKGFCDANPDAIYEVHLLENGNLEFVAIEDSCAHRSSDFFQAEWEPVP